MLMRVVVEGGPNAAQAPRWVRNKDNHSVIVWWSWKRGNYVGYNHGIVLTLMQSVPDVCESTPVISIYIIFALRI